MKYSIIIPVYNGENYLRRCLESVLAQTFTDFEILLIDDGSVDSTSEIYKHFAKVDNRVKFFYKENGGPTSSRKFAIQKAIGEYIICVDSDDTIAINFFDVIDRIIDKEKPDVLLFNYKIIYENGKEKTNQLLVAEGLYYGEELEKIKKTFIFDSDLKGHNLGRISFNLWTKVVRRNFFYTSQMGVRDEITFGEDLLVFGGILKDINSLYVLNFVGYNYFIFPQSISHRNTSKNFNQIDFVCDELIKKGYDSIKIHNYAYSALLSEIIKAAKNLTFLEFIHFITEARKQHRKVFILATKSKFNHLSAKHKILRLLTIHNSRILIYFIIRMYSFIR